MKDETKPKTIEYLYYECGMPAIAIDADDRDEIMNFAKEYARSVAQQVRQECAEKAIVERVDDGTWHGKTQVDQESILSIDIEQFIL